MKNSRTVRCTLWALAATAGLAIGATQSTKQAAFHAENAAAMSKMMKEMSVEPSGDIDRDFAAMMIPHHQGAIDMAIAELRFGVNEQLRRIAQEIIVDQQQEIAAMDLAIGRPLPRPAPSPTQGSSSHPASGSSQVVEMDMPMKRDSNR